MTAADLMALVEKRYAGDAWIVVPEVGNGTGSNVRRHADAIAIGLWPSRGHSIEGLEIKVSRGDVQKELATPQKADAVGKFCDFWWLVVSDLSIIDGLVIPPTWGVLFPKNQVLRVHQKAPKRKAAPVDRGFSAAMIRKVCESWIPKATHEEFKANAKETVRAELKTEAAWKQQNMNYELEDLKHRLEGFKLASGVDLMSEAKWRVGDIGRAVKAIVEAFDAADSNVQGRHRRVEPAELIRLEAVRLREAAERHADAAKRMTGLAFNVEQLAERYEKETVVEPKEGQGWARAMCDQGEQA